MRIFMNSNSRNLAIFFAAIACALLPVTAAYAQRQSPAYSYDAPPRRAHAVKVAPNADVIRRKPRHSQRVLIEEPRSRSRVKHRVITRTEIVRGRPAMIEPRRVVDDSPRVIERRRVVYDPPRVIERRHVVDDPPLVIERYYTAEECPTRRGLFQPGGWFRPGHYCRCNGY
jgi:hypothetical protein